MPETKLVRGKISLEILTKQNIQNVGNKSFPNLLIEIKIKNLNFEVREIILPRL